MKTNHRLNIISNLFLVGFLIFIFLSSCSREANTVTNVFPTYSPTRRFISTHEIPTETKFPTISIKSTTQVFQTILPKITSTNTPILAINTQVNNSQPTETSNTCISEVLFERHNASLPESWFIRPDGSDEHKITSGYHPEVWSPSGSYLLLYKPGSLYVANVDGSEIHIVYELNGADLSFSRWLTDELILVEVRYNLYDPHIYYLYLTNGQIIKPDPDYQRMLLAISPDGTYWIQYTAEGIEIADINENRMVVDIAGGAGSLEPLFNPGIAFIPGGNSIIHQGCIGEPPQSDRICHLYRTEISSSGIGSSQSIFDFTANSDIGGFRVSPDGRFVAFTIYEPLESQWYIYILNINTKKIDYRWPYTYRGNAERFIWSPGSDSILLPYMKNPTSWDGMSILSIKTGQSKILTDGRILDIFQDWKCIQK